MTLLSYLSKAPIVPPGTPVVNALFKQRQCIENVFRACVGLPPINNMMLEYKIRSSASKYAKNPVKSAQTVSHVDATAHKLKSAQNGHSLVANGDAAASNGIANGFH